MKRVGGLVQICIKLQEHMHGNDGDRCLKTRARAFHRMRLEEDALESFRLSKLDRAMAIGIAKFPQSGPISRLPRPLTSFPPLPLAPGLNTIEAVSQGGHDKAADHDDDLKGQKSLCLYWKLSKGRQVIRYRSIRQLTSISA